MNDRKNNILYANLPIPFHNGELNFISNDKTVICKGVLRVNQWEEFLSSYNLLVCVFLSEDRTKITGKVE